MALARYQRRALPEVVGYPRGYAGDGAENTAIAEQLTAFREQFGRTVDPAIAASETNRTRQTIAEGGEVEPALGLTDLQIKRNQVAQQAYNDRVATDLAGQVTALHREFDGQRMTDPDEFAKRLDAYAEPKLASIPEAFRGAATEHFQAIRSRSVTQLQERAFEAEDKRNLADMQAADALDIDALNKAARDGDMALATEAGERLAARRQRMIDAGLMGEEVANYEAAKIADGALAEKLFGDVLRGGGPSLDEIEAGKGAAAALSLESRDRLARQVKAEMAHRRSEQANARAAAEHSIRMNSGVADGITAKVERGLPLTDEERRAADAMLDGAVPISPKAKVELHEATSVGAIVSAATTGTVADAQAALLELDAASPDSVLGDQIRDKSRKKIAEFVADVTGSDPVGALSAKGYFPGGLPPVDFSSPDALGDTLSQRRQVTQIAGQRAGWEIPPLSSIEQEQLATAMSGWSAQDQARALAAIGSDPALLEGLDKGGARVLAYAGLNPDIAPSVLQGREALDLKVVSPPKPDAEKTQFFASEIPLAFSHSDTAQAQIREAATARAAYLAKMAGRPDSIDDFMADAYADVGGKVVDYNGKVALPRGVTSRSEFVDRLESVTDTEIARMAGDVGHFGPVADEIRAGRAGLKSLGGGLYLVNVGAEGWVRLPSGEPFILDFSAIAPKSPPSRLRLGDDDEEPTVAALGPQGHQ